jgi:16S rRNA (guanine(966)-N(2))-methyltransferase RsmD
MSDKVRGALFSSLGVLDDLVLLDAFAGSGALSFEAVSHGAATVIALESDRRAQQTIARNIVTLGIEGKVKLVKASANAWLRTQTEHMFDIVMCDPPYDDLQLPLIALLSRRVQPAGLLILSWPGKQEAPTFENFSVAHSNHYGDIQLVFYRRNG